MFTCITRSADPILSQGMRDNFQKQDNYSVLWDSGVGEIDHIPRIVFFQASDSHRPLFVPGRRFQPMRDRCEPPVHVDSKYGWRRVWYVVALAPVAGVKCRRLLTVGAPRTIRVPRDRLVHDSRQEDA